MQDATPSAGASVPRGGSSSASSSASSSGRRQGSDEAPRPPGPLERLASFRFTYLAFCAFVLFYVFTVRAVEAGIAAHFRLAIAAAVEGASREPEPAARIAERVDALVRDSRWIRIGGVRVDPVVLGADGRSVIYAARLPKSPAGTSRWAATQDALLPAQVRLVVAVPHNALVANAVLVFYATLLLTLLFVYTRVLTRREREHLELVISARDALGERAAQIESELGAVRARLATSEPSRENDAAEIRALRGERAVLLARLGELESREAALRADTEQTSALREEHHALEELLEEALADLGRKDEELRSLQKHGKRTTPPRREDEQLARRLRTLYKNLEIEERAVAELVGLRDETMKLRAEEMLKRLSDDTDTATVRRKVGGLPPHLAIFELGFAGSGRIYFTKGRVRRFRVLSVGDKASQKRDLEFLSRLPRDA